MRDVRGEALSASRGATDFGEYFVYFSFFLVVSALLLASLFFKLGIEQRVREVGLLRSVGFRVADVRRVFLQEGAVLALAGGVLGLAGALGYAWLIVDRPAHLVGGRRGHHRAQRARQRGVAGGRRCWGAWPRRSLCIWWTLRGLARVTERSLLAGDLDGRACRTPIGRRAAPRVAGGAGARGAWAWACWPPAPPARSIRPPRSSAPAPCCSVRRCRSWPIGPGVRPGRAVAGRGWGSVGRLGMRNVSYRPGRAVLSVAVVAAAAFILVTVGSFRRGPTAASADRGVRHRRLQRHGRVAGAARARPGHRRGTPARSV